MGGVLVVYNLGSLGVNIVDSPIQTPDGSLLSCQNAQVSTFDDEIALRKRDGMAVLNATTASGAILAMHTVLFDAP